MELYPEEYVNNVNKAISEEQAASQGCINSFLSAT